MPKRTDHALRPPSGTPAFSALKWWAPFSGSCADPLEWLRSSGVGRFSIFKDMISVSTRWEYRGGIEDVAIVDLQWL